MAQIPIVSLRVGETASKITSSKFIYLSTVLKYNAASFKLMVYSFTNVLTCAIPASVNINNYTYSAFIGRFALFHIYSDINCIYYVMMGMIIIL